MFEATTRLSWTESNQHGESMKIEEEEENIEEEPEEEILVSKMWNGFDCEEVLEHY